MHILFASRTPRFNNCCCCFFLARIHFDSKNKAFELLLLCRKDLLLLFRTLNSPLLWRKPVKRFILYPFTVAITHWWHLAQCHLIRGCNLSHVPTRCWSCCGKRRGSVSWGTAFQQMTEDSTRTTSDHHCTSCILSAQTQEGIRQKSKKVEAYQTCLQETWLLLKGLD